MQQPARPLVRIVTVLAACGAAVLGAPAAAEAMRPLESVDIAPAVAGANPVADPLNGFGPLTAPVRGVSAPVADTLAAQAAILSYWTPARMRDAVPALPQRRAGTPQAPGGLPSLGGLLPLSPPAAPNQTVPNQTAPRQETPAAKPPAAQAPSNGQRTPAGNGGGFRWANAGAVTRTTGKVFFTLDGADYVCSASAVRSTNRDTVVTAGHCVNAGPGNFATRWMFVPGYRDGSRPYGGWTARRLFASDSWRARGDIESDEGFAVVNTSGGRHLTDVVGAQAIGFGAPRKAYAYAFGYPAVGRYDGSALYYCRDTPREDRYGTSDQGISCDMTEGASGGPWLSGFDPKTGTGTITSVSSFGYDDTPDVMWGPYFGDAAKALFGRAQAA